ncbi:coiled-coil domain-containing protein 13 [Eudromia elegans]
MASDVEVNERFQSQFKALQEHQQRRLQNLMARKKEKQNGQKGSNDDTAGAFGSQDNLNLLEIGHPENDDASKRLLESENEQLHDQLREVRDENGRLYKLVREKDFEIKQLQKKIQEDKLALSGTSGLAGDIAATKIVELAKKNREITAETESEKAKVKQLSNRVKELERELQAAIGKINSLGGGGDSGISQSTLKMMEENLAKSPEVKALQEKLTAANFKVMEHRNQLQATKQELKLTQKLLANEVGEDVNIQSLLTNSGSWRGRAQQILVLQGKIRELESRLCQNKSKTSATETDDDPLALADPRKMSVQEKNLLKIRSLEKEKKEALEKLSGEYDALQKDHEETKKKLDASKARNKVLCSEVKTLKGQIVTLLEKGKHDDELIDALLSQQKQMQEILMNLSQQDEKNKRSQQMLGQHLDSEAKRENCLIEQLKQMVAEREAKIKELEEEIGQLILQNKSTHQGDSSGVAGLSPLEHSEDTSFTLLRTLASGSDEVGRTGFACTVSKMGHTLVESPVTRSSLCCNNITPGRLAGTEDGCWEALRTQVTEQRALRQAAELERDRLLGLVATLHKRVEETSDKVLEAEKKLQEERHRCVTLEQQLEKLTLHLGKKADAQKPPWRSKADRSMSQSQLTWNVGDKELSAAQLSKKPLESQIQELSTRLVLQSNENKALKAALETAMRMKEEDFKLYQETMDQAKEIFLQALWQQKQGER